MFLDNIIMHHRLCSYLVNEKNIIFEANQLPKRSFHRACHCSVGWSNSWIIWKWQLYTWGVYWFPRPLTLLTMQHYRKKLENYGIKDTNLAWFRSFLKNRKQYIQITNDSKSSLQNTTCGVPQGSIFRLLDFLVYLNDLPSSSKILK